jgi:hypothetical protein
MSTFSLGLPSSLHRGVKELIKREGVSINQNIATAVGGWPTTAAFSQRRR